MSKLVRPSEKKSSPFWPKGLPDRINLPQTTLVENLEIAARRYPEKPALIFYGGVTSFSQLLSQAQKIAGFLQSRLGVKHGDRVLLSAQNCPQFCAAYHGIQLAGAVVVVVNVMLKSEELRHQAQVVDAKIAVAAMDLMPSFLPLLDDAALEHVLLIQYSDAFTERTLDDDLPAFLSVDTPSMQGPRVTAWSEVIAQACTPDPCVAKPEDPALIAFTSGTTGAPKACLLTHRAIMAATVGSALWRESSPESVFLGVAPMFHMLGLQNAVNVPTYLGATTVLMARWNASLAVRCIAQYGVTHWSAPPPMLVDLLTVPEANPQALRSLKLISGGGGPLPDAIQLRLRDELGVQLVEGWGMTETAGMGLLNPPARAKAQCVGIPTFGVEVKLRDPETGSEAPPGDVGELVMRGAQLLSGYWNDPQATDAAFVTIDGARYFRTGDLARQDKDGYYYIVDRLKRMVVVSGYKVWPAEVETLMFQHPAVQEACVYGMPEPRKGEEVWASVVLRTAYQGQIEAKTLIDWCLERMATYKVPRRVVLVESLPRMSTGKFDWRAAKQQVIDMVEANALNDPC